MVLHVEQVGPTAAEQPDHRLILTHGFTQNTRCWGPFATRLAEENEVVMVDGPGHGKSLHDDADLPAAASLTAAAAGPGIYIGYSMGGRVAIHAALDHPGLVTGLVLIGATAGIDRADQRAARRSADEALADGLLENGLAAFLDRWLSLPLFGGLSDEQAARAERLANRPEGLAASLRNCGTGTQEPRWDELGRLTMPVLVVAGEDDRKFTELGNRLVEAMTGTEAELALVPGTHAVHLERPRPTAELILQTIELWD
ncbi:MAG: alpha/beta fold hydrolase [Acidimicrobiales bacterium]